MTSSTFASCGYTIHVTQVQRVPAVRKTIMMVNGAMSTTASFSWAISALDDFNLILFDSPCIGRSRQYNIETDCPTRQTESDILLDLCERYQPEYLCSMSWGGASTLLALANRPAAVKKAIVGAFSFGVSNDMESLIHRMAHRLNAGEMHEFSDLVNETLGEFLPDRLKIANKKYLSALTDSEVTYLHEHFQRTLSIDKDEAIRAISNIDTETLFINGRKDRYTSSPSVDEACVHIEKSDKIEIDCGHFMAMEDKHIARQLKGVVEDYFT
ncbi:alpha/beta hydrolase [Acidithiobacillus thiooxidans]|nr:alpha/beta hydrolase [Acidithiobacillus thiooxidans]